MRVLSSVVSAGWLLATLVAVSAARGQAPGTDPAAGPWVGLSQCDRADLCVVLVASSPTSDDVTMLEAGCAARRARVEGRVVHVECAGGEVRTLDLIPAARGRAATRETSPPRAEASPPPAWLAPRRRPGLALGGSAGLLIPAGIGGWGELWALHRFEAPVSVRVRLAPLAGVYDVERGPARTGGVLAGEVTLALDLDGFALGMGVGALQYLHRTYETGREHGHTAYGVSWTQSVRLGTADGLHLAVENQLVFADDPEGPLWYGGTELALQIPVADRFAIALRGGWVPETWAFVQGGVRILVDGDGGAGSLLVTPYVGAGGMTTWRSAQLRSENVVGALAGVTLETRVAP